MGGVRTSRVVLHAMWISVLSAIPAASLVALATSTSDGRTTFGQVPTVGLAAVVFAPLWVPLIAAGGALAGLFAAGTDRLLGRRSLLVRQVAAMTAAGVVGPLWLEALSWGNPFDWPNGVIGALFAAMAGGGALSLARRAGARPGIGGWGLAAIILALLAAFLGGVGVVLSGSWGDVVEDCAGLLRVSEAGVSAVSSGVPPQTWCVSESVVQKWNDTPVAGYMWFVGAASLGCAIIGVARQHHRGQSVVGKVLIAVAVIGALSAGAAMWWWQGVPPSASQIERARAEIRGRPGPAPIPPKATVPLARQHLKQLVDAARTTAGANVLWPKRPTITEEVCLADSGESGVMITAVARFTAHEPRDVHGPHGMVTLEHDNERVGARIADAWSRTGLLSSSDIVHGEWWFGNEAGKAIESAHIGFTDGIGEFRIASHCISR